MKKNTTAERLKFIINCRNLKQVDILKMAEPYCRKYGVKLKKNDLSQYLSGKVEPGQHKLSVLGLALNVSEAWLMGYDVPMERDPSENHIIGNIVNIKTKKVPLLWEIACGKPIFADEKQGEYVLTNGDLDCDFCLIAKGDSMTGARIYDGDIVFVKQQDTVENGQVAVVLIGDEATLKRVYYYPEKNKLILNPENPSYEPMVYVGEELSEVRILGRAIAFQSMVR